MTATGHQDAFPPPRLSVGCRFSQATFAGTRGNGRDAPIPAVRGPVIEPKSPATRSFADAALIVLNENNMAARAIHGMIPLGGWSEEVRK